VSETHARVRRRERIEALCAATIRALSGDGALAFRGHRLHRGTRALPRFAPHLHPGDDDDFRASFRGAADGLALRLVLSDDALHRAHAPAEPVERLLFDWLEQFRVEAAAPARWPGVAANLRHRHEAWSLGYCAGGHADSARGLLLYTLAQVARARVAGEGVVEATEDLIEPTRFFLAAQIGHELARLRALRLDQAGYAAPALAIAARVAALLRAAGRSDDATDRETSADDELRSVFGLLLEDERDDPADDRFALDVAPGRRRALDDRAGDAYRVYASTGDRQVDAAELVRREALLASRARLDEAIAERGARAGRLAGALRAVLALSRPRGFVGQQDEGRIDGRALARLVAAPAERAVFRRERIEPEVDVAVTFLIDCSGSMKAHAENVAVLVDVFARALDVLGAGCEVLGFTTGGWNGGRAHRQWLRTGRPANPGRLNERLHVVFKPFAQDWRRARAGIAALLHGEHFREGLDGEALEWAAARLLAREAERRILVVVSDGSPTDGATALANDAHYLDRHLRRVAERIEGDGRIELCAVGVGLDLSPWYARSHVLDLDGDIGRAMFDEVVAMMAAGRGRGSGGGLLSSFGNSAAL
jgi:cobaltochelatase CobT